MSILKGDIVRCAFCNMDLYSIQTDIQEGDVLEGKHFKPLHSAPLLTTGMAMKCYKCAKPFAGYFHSTRDCGIYVKHKGWQFG